MKNLDSAMDTALLQSTTYLCRIWVLTLQNGSIYRFTDASRSIVFDGEIYDYDPGVTVSSVMISSGAQSDNATIEIAVAANFLSKARIRQGALKGAQFEIYVVDWRDPDNYGPIELFAGSTSDVKFTDRGKVQVDLNSDIGGDVNRNIGEYYSRQCRALLGDERCRFDLEGAKIAFEIATITDNGYGFTTTELVGGVDDRFKFGKIAWTDGLNDTLQDEVKSSTAADGSIRLSLYPRNPLVIGDTGFAYPGCDFQVTTCGDKFNNLVNYRGEPFVPPPTIVVFSGLTNFVDTPNGLFMQAPSGTT